MYKIVHFYITFFVHSYIIINNMPQYIKFIYDNDPLYEVIKEWDEAFSLDGNLCDNPSKTKQMILQKARMKGRK